MPAGVRRCDAIAQSGQPCGTAPLRGEAFCLWHHPDYAEEAAEARRQGGLRRRREGTLQGEYEFEGLETVPQIRRVLELAVLETLALDNSIARVRALGSLSQIALRALDVGDLEERLGALEAAQQRRGTG
jgi:hypothetical protein